MGSRSDAGPRHQGQPGSIWVSWLYSRIGVLGSVDHVDMERREKKSGLRQAHGIAGKAALGQRGIFISGIQPGLEVLLLLSWLRSFRGEPGFWGGHCPLSGRRQVLPRACHLEGLYCPGRPSRADVRKTKVRTRHTVTMKRRLEDFLPHFAKGHRDNEITPFQ